MTVLRISAADAFRGAARNPLRMHPTPRKDTARLLPFAQPAMVMNTRLSGAERYAVIGDCFARSIEHALTAAMCPVLSSPVGLGMPGDPSMQTTRFIVFNLDVALQNLRWLTGEASAPIDAPLCEVGGETVNLSIAANFSYPRPDAERYWRIHLEAFRPVLDADVVILVTGGNEQWFDTLTGLYVNGFVVGPMAAAFPGRFELHRIDSAHSVNTLLEIMALLRRHSSTTPHFILSTSSASEPMTYLPGDILVEYMLARATQRVAIQQVLEVSPDASYMPALEALVLSDRNWCFQQNSLNHTTHQFADRVVAEMLRAGGAEGPAQQSLMARGIAGMQSYALDHQGALDTIRAFLATDPPQGSYNPDIFTTILNQSYTSLRMIDERGELHLANSDPALQPGERLYSPAQSYHMALQSATSSTSLDLVERIIAARGTREMTEDTRLLYERALAQRDRLAAAAAARNPPAET